jgi:hypothetical protein
MSISEIISLLKMPVSSQKALAAETHLTEIIIMMMDDG